MKILIIKLFFLLQFFILTSVNAEPIDEMVASMNKKLADMTLLNESVVRGGLRTRLCQQCHGKDGNSKRGDYPNLAGQHPVYLLTQFEHFKTGKRKYKVMNELAKGLTEEERINIALYYASQKVTVNGKINSNSSLYRGGDKIYQSVCINCHGKKGYGDVLLPRIAGQKSDFIVKTLTAYKDKKHLRPNSPMSGIAASLSYADIDSVAAYVSLMD